MLAAQAFADGAEATQNPVDYYAGIVALCVLILFATFHTHATRPKEVQERTAKKAPDSSSRAKFTKWTFAHLACIVFAFIAIGDSLYVLGWGDASKSYESFVRGSVAVGAGIASLILVADVLDQR